jgi:hypothetical protein
MKKKIPTNKQVQKEIDTLREYKPRIVQFSAFGDDNHAKIDVEIEVLEKHLGGDTMDDYDIDDKLDEGDWTDDEASSARDIVSWLKGNPCEDGGVPSDNWKCLVK